MNSMEEIPVGADSFLSDAGALDDGLRLGGAGVWRWRIDSDRLQWTRNLETVHHLPPGSFDGSLASFQRDLHPEDADGVWQKIKACIETGDPYRAVYRTSPRLDRADVWIETSGGIVLAPDGARYLTGVCLDVSARVRNERQLKRILGQQRAVARFGAFALEQGDLQSVLDEAVRVAADVLDVPLTKILQFADAADHLVLRAGIGWADGLVGHGTVGIDRDSQAGFTLLETAPVIVRDLLCETRFNGPQLLHDHGVRSGVSVIIPGSEARPFGVFGIHARAVRIFDEADAEFLQSLAHIVAGAARQAAAAGHRLLLMREMAHRAGNMLQLVNSIASQTFAADADTQLARRSFSDRLSALARSNYVVARGGWSSTPFAELVEETLKPFGDRVTAEGRNVLLPPELCFDMGLVLHELATNSMKYGTLGRPEGTVRVCWAFRTRADGTRIFWLEWDDVLSTAQQSAKGSGFGSKLIGALIERKWNGILSRADAANFRIGMEIPVAA
ncbi:HWE histidine kinase domain-containing protein [Aquibium sp. ELW1220]|uniref:sensor histidine kinase n=1 Tax=Aquibium sp. ELW1220 TaxID=2976766 RepID=UPI0025B1ACD3|nr:HWE histidine kinase domain-containing protein [Aquibium sp. ELW1220]MDN2583869.1 GAF domain-containing protein [Aquibium sp. ELW1220]